MDLTEITRLAAAVNALRPDWPHASLVTFISRDLATRAYRDAAVALAWVACDPNTATPKRVLEAGPWWDAVAVGSGKEPSRPDQVDWVRCPKCGRGEVRALQHEPGGEMCGALQRYDQQHAYEAGPPAARQALAAARAAHTPTKEST